MQSIKTLPLAALVSALAPLTAVPAMAQTSTAPVADGAVFAQASTLPFQTPDFSKIKDSDFRPALLEGIKQKQAEIDAIANNPEAPAFANTIEALERSGQMLDRVNAVFSALTGANTNDTLDAVDAETAPMLTALSDSITLNDRLFARIKALYDQRTALNLAPDQLQVLTLRYDNMVRNGALLSAADKAKLKDINGKLSTLETQFGQKLTAGTRDAALVVTGKGALSGLSEAEVAAAAKAAADRKLPTGRFVIPLQNTTQQPQLSSLKNRATRQALFAKGWTRSEQGGANDTRAMILEQAALRAEKARLLGFKDYASLAISNQMAKTPENAVTFLNQMVPALAAAQKRDAAELNTLVKARGGKFAVTPADWDYYSGLLRQQKYAFDDSQVKPYLEITNVLENGVFFAANKLYGLTFTKRTDLPVYHPDVTVYQVNDQDGSELALFYFDPWKRDNKRGGAWMSNFVDQSGLMGTKPVVYNVSNYAKPAPGQPALVTWDDAETMFHEFGHALHGMLSNQRYPSIAGTNTARDFVEFPSQFNENWMTEPAVLANFAKHYQTGAPMPAELVAKIEKAKTFNQAYALGEVVAAQLLDLKWHSLPAGSTPKDVNAFEDAALKASGLDVAHVPPRYRTSYFRHIWGGGYAAAYYAYGWTEMLDHDAFQWFKDNGGMTRANGQKFRDTVLSQGHSADYATMYRNLTGRDPSIEPMLKARGLK